MPQASCQIELLLTHREDKGGATLLAGKLAILEQYSLSYAGSLASILGLCTLSRAHSHAPVHEAEYSLGVYHSYVLWPDCGRSTYAIPRACRMAARSSGPRCTERSRPAGSITIEVGNTPT